MSNSRETLLESLRMRVMRGLQAGTLAAGDRLPSARQLAAEFAVDHRLVIAAYRLLEDEGLVEVRQRGGVYVGAAYGLPGVLALPERWFAEVMADALVRDVPGPQLGTWLARAMETIQLHAAVISTTDDQVAGLCRELGDDFGLVAEGATGADIERDRRRLLEFRRADVVIATSAHAELGARVGAELGAPCIIVDVRPDLVAGEWALLLRQPVWAIVATREFGEMLRRFFASVPGIENLHVLVLGHDDLGAIPKGAPTYVTHRVRESLGGRTIPGRILPAARTIATDSARQIFEFIVGANLRAYNAVRGDAFVAARQDQRRRVRR